MARRGNTNIDVMRDEAPSAVEQNFIGGLKTEFTGLNFPQHCATDVENCIFTLTGDVTRRLGFNYETNFVTKNVNRTASAISTFKWMNAGGDGETQLLVVQIGSMLYFYQTTNATTVSPLSTTLLTTTIDINTFKAAGNTNTISLEECNFASGNGYLFVFHPDCDPFYCTFNSGAVVANLITVQIRDFLGFYPEPGAPAINFRPTTLSDEHNYNLQNQGWTGAPPWTGTSSNFVFGGSGNNVSMATGSQSVTIATGLTITASTAVSISWLVHSTIDAGGVLEEYNYTGTAQGTVVSYTSATGALTLDVTSSSTSTSPAPLSQILFSSTSLQPGNSNNTINSFFSAEHIYPANSDVWYAFKDSSGNFNPTSMYGNVPPSTTPAPRGHFILNAFNQNQAGVSGLTSLTSLSTTVRPSTGTWFQGRIWYTGINSSQASSGDQNFYTWSENIYFSQVNEANDVTTFGYCYQTNDPTDETLFAELPTDGGVITIQGCGDIYKLFPIQNGMLVFAANGIWFITGSQGIGFAANDYTITKISSVRTISHNSFVEVNGLPMFWNEEGIYTVQPAQQGLGLQVVPITLGTIKSFYDTIPYLSKVYVKVDYNPITYVVQWFYRSTQETTITDRYQYDSALCFNVHTNAFYKYQLPAGVSYIHDVIYIANPGGLTSEPAKFKYLTSTTDGLGSYNFTFSEEYDTSYFDWKSYDTVGQDYTSYFITGYSLFGQGMRKFQCEYLNMFTRIPSQYIIQSIWDYAISGNSGRYSSKQKFSNTKTNYGMDYNRIKVRGYGVALQIKVSSVPGQPFDMMGWTMWITQNASV